MTSLNTPTTQAIEGTRGQLLERVGKVANRVRLLKSASVVVIALGGVVGGLFLVGLVDAVVPMGGVMRLLLLLGLLLIAGVMMLRFAIRAWSQGRHKLAAAQQIDEAVHAPGQPVLQGVTLPEPSSDDALSIALRHRAEQRAAELAQSIKPRRAYPFSHLHHPGGWIVLGLLAWLILWIVFPWQFGNVLSRVLTPWVDSPAFSMTRMQPIWAPVSPGTGDDVSITVMPAGKLPNDVTLLRIGDDGQVAERFEMSSYGHGGFTHIIRKVDEPYTFKLETNGRSTRAFTIEPTDDPPAQQDPPEDPDQTEATPPGASGADGGSESEGGSTTFDPEAVAQRDLAAHPDWPGLQSALQKLIADLTAAQARAQSIDPNDLAAMQQLDADLAGLAALAEALSEQVGQMQSGLSPQAAGLLDQLKDALSKMQCQALGACPGGSSEGSDSPPNPDAPTPEQWLDQAGEAAGADSKSVANGLGRSDSPTEIGTTSGSSDGDAPTFTDPRTGGGYDEASVSGETGPLPPAVMRQVPPSYRAHIAAYFNRLTEESEESAP